MRDFLNPKSMLTPGIAGAFMMFLVNGIRIPFPEISGRYLALFLSFLIGTIVWSSEIKGDLQMVKKAVYWIMNSLIIFVVGFGYNNLGIEPKGGAGQNAARMETVHLISNAYARNFAADAMKSVEVQGINSETPNIQSDHAKGSKSENAFNASEREENSSKKTVSEEFKTNATHQIAADMEKQLARQKDENEKLKAQLQELRKQNIDQGKDQQKVNRFFKPW